MLDAKGLKVSVVRNGVSIWSDSFENFREIGLQQTFRTTIGILFLAVHTILISASGSGYRARSHRLITFHGTHEQSDARKSPVGREFES